MRVAAYQKSDAETLSKALKKHRPKLHSKVHAGPVTTSRVDSYKNHRIEIRTTYEIKVDGKRVGGHIGVSNSGHVHYHALPNYSWASAVDLVRQIIDSFPEEFPKPKRSRKARRGGAHSRHRGH